MKPLLQTIMRFTKIALPVLLLSACALTAAQQSTLDALATAAVAVDIQKGTSDPTQWTARAKKIKTIATQLEAVNAATAQSLPAVLAALTPIIAAAGLNPIDIAIANALVADFQVLLTNQLGANPTAAQVQTSVSGVLNAIIAATAVYGA